MSLNNILLSKSISVNAISLIEVTEDCSEIANTVLNKIIKHEDSLCLIKYFIADKNFSYQEIINLNGVGSLFGDKIIAVVKYNNSSRPTVDHAKELENLAKELSVEDRVVQKIVVLCEKFEYKQKKSKVYNALLAIAEMITVGNDRNDLIVWVKYLFAEKSLQIEARALDYLLQLNSNNIEQLYQNVLQLSYLYYTNNGESQDSTSVKPEISLVNVTDFISNNSKYNIFMLSQSYLKADKKLTMMILKELDVTPENRIMIVWMITDDIRKMLAVKLMLQTNSRPSIQTISSEIHVWGDRVNHLLLAARRISYKAMLSILNDLSQIDLMQKGVISSSDYALSQCVLKFL